MQFWSRTLVVGVVLVALMSVGCELVAAQHRPTEAVRLYERARERYAVQDYEGAAALLERAVALDPNSTTLSYNLARAYEQAGDLVRARAYFERVIETAPAGNEDRTQAEESLVRLAQTPGTTGTGTGTTGTGTGRTTTPDFGRDPLATDPGAPVGSPAPARRMPHGDERFDGWFFTFLIGGVLAGAGAAAFGVLAFVNNDALNRFVIGRDGTLAAHDQKVVDIVNFAMVSDVFSAGAAALLTTSLLLVLLRDGPLTQQEIDAQSQPRARLDLGLGGLVLNGTF